MDMLEPQLSYSNLDCPYSILCPNYAFELRSNIVVSLPVATVFLALKLFVVQRGLSDLASSV